MSALELKLGQCECHLPLKELKYMLEIGIPRVKHCTAPLYYMMQLRSALFKSSSGEKEIRLDSVLFEGCTCMQEFI